VFALAAASTNEVGLRGAIGERSSGRRRTSAETARVAVMPNRVAGARIERASPGGYPGV